MNAFLLFIILVGISLFLGFALGKGWISKIIELFRKK